MPATLLKIDCPDAKTTEVARKLYEAAERGEAFGFAYVYIDKFGTPHWGRVSRAGKAGTTELIGAVTLLQNALCHEMETALNAPDK